MVTYYSHIGSKLFIPNSYFFFFNIFLSKNPTVIPFSFDYIHKDRQKERKKYFKECTVKPKIIQTPDIIFLYFFY